MVRKFRPDDYWRIGEHESWFSDMALEGLHLKKIGKRIAKFEKGESKKTRYRIDIHNSEYTNVDKKEFYTENGWNFVTDYDDFNVYSSPEELNAAELHTDPVEQAHTLKTIEDKMAGVFSIFIIGPIVMLVMLYLMLFKDSTFSYGLLDDSTMLGIIILFIGLRGIYDNGRSFFAIRRLRKTLLEGKSINHNAPWKSRNRTSMIISYTLLALILMVYALSVLSNIKKEVVTLENTSPNLPIVRLVDVEQNPDLIQHNEYTPAYYYNWKILAPIHYKSWEKGKVPNELWNEDGNYTPSIITDTYKVAIPKMAKGVFNGLIKRSDNWSSSGEFTEINNPNFERLVIHKDEGFTEVFAYKGSGVIRVRYFGYAGVDNIIKAIEGKINLISH